MRMKSASRRLPEFLSTHPLDENRIADSKNRSNSLPGVDHIQNIEYLLMKYRVEIYYANNSEAAIAEIAQNLPQLNGIEEDAARYGMALGLLKNGQFVAASESLDDLLRKDPNRISYVMLQADIAREAGFFGRALEVLEDNLEINPNNNPLSMAYVQTLVETGRHADAAEFLERHTLNRPNDPELWFQLAEIQGQAGNIDKVHQARGEYFITVGDFTRARNQFSLALGLESDRLVRAKIQQRLDYIRDLENRFYR
jgi:predicted Zn-dependent protease